MSIDRPDDGLKTPSQEQLPDPFRKLPEVFERKLANAGKLIRGETPPESLRGIEGLEALQDAQDVLAAALVAAATSKSQVVSFKTKENFEEDLATGVVSDKFATALMLGSPGFHVDFGMQVEGDDSPAYQAFWAAYKQAIVSRLGFLRRSEELARTAGLLHADPMEGEDVTATFLLRERLATFYRSAVDIIEAEVPGETPEVLRNFPEPVREELLRQLFTIELTKGCTVRCDFCGLSAGGKLTGKFAFGDVLKILAEAQRHIIEDKSAPEERQMTPPFLYYATDPYDYRAKDRHGVVRNYADVLTAYRSIWARYPFTSTAYPKGAKAALQRSGLQLSRLSLSDVNRDRLQEDGLIQLFDREHGTFVPTDPGLAESLFFGGTKKLAMMSAHFMAFGTMKAKDVAARYWMRNPGISEVYNFLSRPAAIQYSYAGRQRAKPEFPGEERKPGEDPLGNTIACRDGVIIGPLEVRNSVRLFASDRYPDGLSDAVIKTENLALGAQKAAELGKRAEEQGEVHIEELLPYVVIRFSSANEKMPSVDVVDERRVDYNDVSFTYYAGGDFSQKKRGTMFVSMVTGLVKKIELEQ